MICLYAYFHVTYNLTLKGNFNISRDCIRFSLTCNLFNIMTVKYVSKTLQIIGYFIFRLNYACICRKVGFCVSLKILKQRFT